MKKKRQENNTARSFAKLLFEGKVRAALRLLTNQSTGGVLPLDKTIPLDSGHTITVREVLQVKHPPGQTADHLSCCGT